MMTMLVAMLVQAADPADVSGFYESRTMEVGAAIALDPDGKFAFGLEYGGISERADGTWVREGNVIYLTATEHQMNWEAPKFDRTPVRIDGSVLWLQRHDRDIRFVREDLPLSTKTNDKVEN